MSGFCSLNTKNAMRKGEKGGLKFDTTIPVEFGAVAEGIALIITMRTLNVMV